MSKALLKTTEMDEVLMARQLSEQYQRAVGGLWEVVKFGAMLAHLRDSLNSARGIQKGQIQYQGSLKEWIVNNCPEISIASAWRFMAIAEGLREELQVPERVDLVALLTADHATLEPKLLKHRERIANFLEGKSQRQLLLSFGEQSAPTRKLGGAAQLDAFLREHNPELVGTPFKKLPEATQKAWQAFLDQHEKKKLNGMTREEFRARELWDDLIARLHEERTRRKLYLALPIAYLKRIDAALMDFRADLNPVIKRG